MKWHVVALASILGSVLATEAQAQFGQPPARRLGPNSSGNSNSGQFQSPFAPPAPTQIPSRPPQPQFNINIPQQLFMPRPNNSQWNRQDNWQEPAPRPYQRPQYQRPQTQYYSDGDYNYDNRGSQWREPEYQKTYSQRPIRIICPESCVGQCDFELLNASGKSYKYAITGGERQNFKETTDWRVRFDQGQGRGYKTYSLRGGKVYELRQNGEGVWAFATVGDL